MINKENLPEEESYADKYKGEVMTAWRTFDETLKINPEDGFVMRVLKVTGRVLGITVAIILSPFVALGLFFAFIAVS